MDKKSRTKLSSMSDNVKQKEEALIKAIENRRALILKKRYIKLWYQTHESRNDHPTFQNTGTPLHGPSHIEKSICGTAATEASPSDPWEGLLLEENTQEFFINAGIKSAEILRYLTEPELVAIMNAEKVLVGEYRKDIIKTHRKGQCWYSIAQSIAY